MVSLLCVCHAALLGCAGSPPLSEPPPGASTAVAPPPSSFITAVSSAAAPPSAAPAAVEAELPSMPLPLLREVRSTDKEHVKLKVEYAEVRFGDRKAFVRTYNGKLVGPTMRVRPGSTLYVDFENALPDDPSDPAGTGHSHHAAPAAGKPTEDINIPHGFNVTNLHTHGLHVRPDYPSRCKGNAKCDAVADNVMIDVLPGKSQRYEIEIPKDHAPGTHWYHAHKHGSVALQLASGMAGVLIVEGGLDDVPEIKKAKEQIMAFQQLRITDCGRKEVTKGQGPEQCSLGDAPNEKYYESCDAYFQRLVDAHVLPSFPKGDSCVESFEFSFGANRMGQVLQPRFGSRTSINGEITPTIEMRQGELQRWRLLHAGILETLELGLVSKEGALTQRASDALENEKAAAERIRFKVIAYDGLATGRIDDVDHLELESGYRADALVRFDKPGDYELIDLKTKPVNSLQGGEEDFHVVAKVHVTPSSEPPMPLPTEAALAPLAPHKHVEDKEVKGCQYTTFNFGKNPQGGTTFLVNGAAYDPATPPRTMTLGVAQEWVVNSASVNHPYHIHTNPFELMTDYHGIKKGTWKDTMLIRQDEPLRIRTRYEDFTGTFVLHCHILNHEDQGMMQTVEILPAGKKDSSCPVLPGPNMCAATPPADGKCAAPTRR
jgi:FtsP/CotA-like multicopper oxidase with cupredoxin domain